jgi:hypothetical protein
VISRTIVALSARKELTEALLCSRPRLEMHIRKARDLMSPPHIIIYKLQFIHYSRSSNRWLRVFRPLVCLGHHLLSCWPAWNISKVSSLCAWTGNPASSGQHCLPIYERSSSSVQLEFPFWWVSVLTPLLITCAYGVYGPQSCICSYTWPSRPT